MSEPNKPTFWPRAAAIAAAVMYAVAIDNNALPNLLRNLNSGANTPMFIFSHPLSIFIILLISPRVLLGLRGWAEGALFAAAYGFFAQFLMLFAQAAVRQMWTEALIYGPLMLLFFLFAARVDAVLSTPRKIGHPLSLEIIITIGLAIAVIPFFTNYLFMWSSESFDWLANFQQIPAAAFIINFMSLLLLLPVAAVYIRLSRTLSQQPEILWFNHGSRGIILLLLMFMSAMGVKVLGPGIAWMWPIMRGGNVGVLTKAALWFWNFAHMAADGLIFSALGPIHRERKMRGGYGLFWSRQIYLYWSGHLVPAVLAAALIGIGWIIYYNFRF